MKRVDMGKTYFKLNNSPESREPLVDFFRSNGTMKLAIDKEEAE